MENIKQVIDCLSKDMEYKWRVQSFSKNKPSAVCVAYIDARDVMDRLDSCCPEGWSDRYYQEAGLLFCEITIHLNGVCYKRTDTGTESQADKEKGHASDAFKRAAVKFGVGRFLYNLGVKYLPSNESKTNSNFPFVVDANGKRVWDISEHINQSKVKTKQEPKTIALTDKEYEACLKASSDKIVNVLFKYDGVIFSDGNIYTMKNEQLKELKKLI